MLVASNLSPSLKDEFRLERTLNMEEPSYSRATSRSGFHPIMMRSPFDIEEEAAVSVWKYLEGSFPDEDSYSRKALKFK